FRKRSCVLEARLDHESSGAVDVSVLLAIDGNGRQAARKPCGVHADELRWNHEVTALVDETPPSGTCPNCRQSLAERRDLVELGIDQPSARCVDETLLVRAKNLDTSQSVNESAHSTCGPVRPRNGQAARLVVETDAIDPLPFARILLRIPRLIGTTKDLNLRHDKPVGKLPLAPLGRHANVRVVPVALDDNATRPIDVAGWITGLPLFAPAHTRQPVGETIRGSEPRGDHGGTFGIDVAPCAVSTHRGPTFVPPPRIAAVSPARRRDSRSPTVLSAEPAAGQPYLAHARGEC